MSAPHCMKTLLLTDPMPSALFAAAVYGTTAFMLGLRRVLSAKA